MRNSKIPLKVYKIIEIMSNINLKDRKILCELDLNCRQSNSKIGKKVGLGRDVVSYRINKMEKEGIIEDYWALIDTFRLGYDVFRIYIDFQYVSSDVKKEIIQYFVDYKYSWVVATIKSEIDLDVVVWVKNIFEFYQFLDKTLDKYGAYFEDYSISIYTEAKVYQKSYLLPEKKVDDRLIGTMRCGCQPVFIDETDYVLLNELAVNARAPLVDLADKIGCSSQNVRYRIKKLVESKVIKAFRVNIDLPKVNLNSYKIDIYLKDHKLKKPVFDYLKNKPYLEFMNFALGWADLEPELVVKDFNELLQVLDEINKKFSGAIKKQSFFIIEEEHKLRCLPEIY